MPPISRLTALCALMLAATPALAADFDRPYPPGPGYAGGEPPLPSDLESRGPPRFTLGPRFEGGPDPEPREACREFVRRRLDAYGEPVLRRVRICDEPSYDRGPPPPPLPPDEIPPRRRGEGGW